MTYTDREIYGVVTRLRMTNSDPVGDGTNRTIADVAIEVIKQLLGRPHHTEGGSPMTDIDQTIIKYATVLQDIYDRRIAGAYTFDGVLANFAREITPPDELVRAMHDEDAPSQQGSAVTNLTGPTDPYITTSIRGIHTAIGNLRDELLDIVEDDGVATRAQRAACEESWRLLGKVRDLLAPAAVDR